MGEEVKASFGATGAGRSVSRIAVLAEIAFCLLVWALAVWGVLRVVQLVVSR